MKYQLKIVVFGGLKAYFTPEMSLEVDEESTIGELLVRLETSQPTSCNLLSVCVVAIDGTVFPKEHKIGKALEMAILPPFSGG